MERRGVRRTILVLALGGILSGGGSPAIAMTGSSGGVAWEIRDATRTARADGRATRWDYAIQLRDTRGVGIQFEKIERVLLGHTVTSAPREGPYRERLKAGGELRLVVADWIQLYSSVQSGFGVQPGGQSFTAVRRFVGKDDSGKSVTVEVRAELGQGTGRALPAASGTPGPQMLPPVPVTDLKAVAGEWQGHYRNVDGFDIPLRLVIGEDGAFVGIEGDPVRSRYRGTLALSDGRLAWKTRGGTGPLALHDDRGKRILAGRVIVTPADRGQPHNFDVRVESLGPASVPGSPPVVAARPVSPPPPPSSAVGAPATAGPTIVVRFPLEQARVSDPFTVLVADVTSGQVLASAAVSVNGVRVHEQTEPGTRALALNVPVTLREGANVIVVSVTDGQGGVRQEVRTVVHEPSAGIRVSYRVRGSALWVNLLYRAPDGRTEQKKVMLPPDAAWELLFNARNGDSLEVTAQSVESGSVSCEIFVDGRPIAERSGSKDTPVTCRGIVSAP